MWGQCESPPLSLSIFHQKKKKEAETVPLDEIWKYSTLQSAYQLCQPTQETWDFGADVLKEW